MNNTMKTDALVIPFNNREELVIASDNSGSIGMKQLDDVHVPYDIVGYFSFRVAYMECLAAGGRPISISLMNFNGNQVWEQLIQGINRGIEELGIEPIPVTGSTESNFSLQQSAMAVTVLGRREIKPESKQRIHLDDYQLAVIGKPLVGYEVINCNDEVAPLHLFQWFNNQKEVISILPVGSKGIAFELSKAWPNHNFILESDLDLKKSSGPATCFIAIYHKNFHHAALKKASKWIHN